MTISTLIIWLILIVIGVFDAREQRIPNSWVMLLLVSAVVDSTFAEVTISSRLFGFFILFSLMLLLYMVGGIAAGDVKLAAVLGYILSFDELASYSWMFAFSCIFIGMMYKLLKRLSAVKSGEYDECQAIVVSISFREKSPIRIGSTYMPLAPVMIIALAIHSYFSHFS